MMHLAAFALLVLGAAPGRAAPWPLPGTAAPAAQGADPEATRIALAALAAIERGWALALYDEGTRVRATVNLRGTNGLGVTANLALDRRAGRWRLDTGGDVGPLTLHVDAERATLYVPALAQFASRPAGELSPPASVGRSLSAEIAAVRRRLEAGYPALTYRGDGALDGAAVHVIEDHPAPGLTTTFWIDAQTSLPRRVSVARSDGREARVDLQYGAGPRPTLAVATFPGSRALRLTLTPRYDSRGRVSRLAAQGRLADGTGIDADVNVLWSAQLGAAYFRFSPPAGTQRVSFEQLASGVLLAAAGKLGPLVSVFLQAR